jgi:hypothetical protein
VAGRRRERLAQFGARTTGSYATLSGSLIYCGLIELDLALEGRKQPVLRTVDNHYTRHALGSIVLLITALEAWLNEVIADLAPMHRSQFPGTQLYDLADKPIEEKYYAFPRLLGAPVPPQPDLDLVLSVRNEIVHYLPRVLPGEGQVPPWLVDLHRRGVFLTAAPPVDMTVDRDCHTN